MGLRFRKSVKLGKGLRLNVSKSGVGISGGVKGFRVGVGPRGVRTTASIPGTGISYVKDKSLGNKKKGKKNVGLDIEDKTSQTPFLSPYVPKELRSDKHHLQSILGGIGILCLFLTYRNTILFFVGVAAIYGKSLWRKQTEKEGKSYKDAITYFKTKKYNKCIEALDIVLQHPKASKDLYLVKAECFLQIENPFDAYAIYKEYFQRFDPKDVLDEIYLPPKSMAISLAIDNEDYDFALKIIESLPDETLEGTDFKLWKNYFKGKCFLGKKQYEIAVEAFTEAVGKKRRMEEPFIDCHYSLGIAYWKTGKKSLATKRFQRVYASNTSYKNISEIIAALEKDKDINSLI